MKCRQSSVRLYSVLATTSVLSQELLSGCGEAYSSQLLGVNGPTHTYRSKFGAQSGRIASDPYASWSEYIFRTSLSPV